MAVAAGTVAVGDGVAADGVPAGGLAGDPAGGLDGDGVAVGDGADHDLSWRRDFMAADVVVRRLVPGPWGPRWVLVNRCW